jgi:hypothetical protein
MTPVPAVWCSCGWPRCLQARPSRGAKRVKPYITGERFPERQAPRSHPPQALATGMYIYTFNQVVDTEVWGREYFARLVLVA